VAGQDQEARAGKQGGGLLFEALHAGPAGDEGVRRRALRAGGRCRDSMAAMVTDEPVAEAVLHQPGVAVGALQAKSAAAAERERCVAATIEEQERLLAALHRELHGFGQTGSDEAT